jgi:hypothetical protein
MSGLFAAMLIVLGASAPLHPPDLQIEAGTVSGSDLPELAEAVARALVAGGARVVLRGPGSGPCEDCTKVRVTEAGSGNYRVDVGYHDRAASTVLRLPQGSLLFDRARAIAIQTRLLVTWDSDPPSRAVAARPSRRLRPTAQADQPPESRPQTATAPPSLPQDSELLPDVPAASAESAAPVPPLVRAAQGDSEPAPRKVEAKTENLVNQEPAARAEDSIVRREDALAKSRRRAKVKPSIDLSTAATEPPPHRWPWIPTAIGAGAAIGAGICAMVARDRYNALSDKNQPYDNARTLKSQGEGWQVAAFVLGGVAAAGLATGIVGFSMRPTAGSSLSASVSPVPGGGMIAVAGDLP